MPNSRLRRFGKRRSCPYLSACGYAYGTAIAVFGVVSIDMEGFDVQAVDDVLNVVGAGFSPEEVLGIMAAGVEGREAPNREIRTFRLLS